MAFKFCALFFVSCIAMVRSAIIQNELPVPIANQITNEMFRFPQIPFQSLQNPGVTIQQGDLQLLAPEDKLIPFDKLDALYKATGLVAKLKGKSLKLLKKGIKLFAKVAVVGVVLFSIAAVGIAITAVFCKKTGFCDFKFHKFEFDKEHIEAVRSLVSDDRVARLTKFVMNAIEEHSKEE